jgi:hypothetical protein
MNLDNINLKINSSKTNMQITILGLILIFFGKNIKADDTIKNETGKYGNPQTISVYTSHTKTWRNLGPNQEGSFKVDPDGPREHAHMEIVAWTEGNKTYLSNFIRRPKNTYIYNNGSYLTWSWPDNGGFEFATPNLKAKEIKKENIEAEIEAMKQKKREDLLASDDAEQLRTGKGDIIKNETGKFGKAMPIEIYTSHTNKWVKVNPNTDKHFFVSPDGPREHAHMEIVAWTEGDKTYMSKFIRRPKNTYIYSNGAYLTWSWPDNGGAAFETKNLQAIEIKKENVAAEIKKAKDNLVEALKETDKTQAARDAKSKNDAESFWKVVGIIAGGAVILPIAIIAASSQANRRFY